MRITYFALKPRMVEGELREPGDLIPEAAEWPYLASYVADGIIAPVLVATLPEESQLMLLDWEASRLPATDNENEKVDA